MAATLGSVFCRMCLIVACVITAASTVLLGVSFPPLAILAFAGMIWRRSRQWAAPGWAHGTARIATLDDLFHGGLLAGDGLLFGRTDQMAPPTKAGAVKSLFSLRVNSGEAVRLFLAAFFVRRFSYDQMIRIKKFVHLAVFGPAGSGKSVSVLVPNLRSYRGNAVVTDPKGELYKLTAEHRRRKFGHRIVLFDPFGICKSQSAEGASDCFNPLATIDVEARDFVDRCRDLANMLVVRAGTEPDPHWNNMAEQVISAFIGFVCACEPNPERRTLDTVRSLLASRHRFNRALDVMQKVTALRGVIQRAGHSLTHAQSDELGSILTSVQRHTQFLDSPAVADQLSSTTFDPGELRSGKMTIYLCLPADKLETLSSLMRLWIGSLLRAASRDHEQNPVMFFLDEAGHLGKMQALQQAVTLMRGMGIRLWFFFQSLGQVQTCFGDSSTTILDNIETQFYLGTNAFETADAISKRVGDMTVVVESLNYSSSESQPDGQGLGQQGGSRSSSQSRNYSEQGRRIWRAEEILTLPHHMGLLFHRNLPVIPVRLLRYYDDPAFRRGGSGATRGLGLKAAVASATTLMLSLSGLVLVLLLASPRRIAVAPAGRQATVRPGPVGLQGDDWRGDALRSTASAGNARSEPSPPNAPAVGERRPPWMPPEVAGSVVGFGNRPDAGFSPGQNAAARPVPGWAPPQDRRRRLQPGGIPLIRIP